MKLLSCKSEAGFSLLEQALVLPIALTFIVGVLDVNSIFQANTAMHDGVTEALRCLTPTDGACTVDASSANVFYPVKRSKAELRWEVPQYSYSANLAFYSAPTLANTEFVIKTSNLPTVDARNSTLLALDPIFSDKSSLKEIKEKKLRDVSATVSGNEQYKFIKIVPVGILPEKPAGTCFVAEKNNKGVAKKDSNGDYILTDEKCDNDDVRFMIQVYGNTTGTSNGAKGEVHMYYTVTDANANEPSRPNDLVNPNTKKWHTLGGRQIDQDSSGSFYTRGAQNIINKPVNKKGDYEIKEYELDYNDLKAEGGKKVWLLFILKKNKGDTVAWNATGIKMFTEQFDQKKLCNIECQDTAVNGKCSVNYQNKKLVGEGAAEPSVLGACELVNAACGTKIVKKEAPEGTVVSDNKLFITSDEYKGNSSCLKANNFNLANYVKEPSLLYGKHEPSCNWEDELRKEILNIKNPSFEKYLKYANISRKEVGTEVLKARPTFACNEARQKQTSIGAYEEIKGSPMKWEDIPAYCFNSYEWLCDIGTPIMNGTPYNLSHNTDLAVARAENAIYSSLPWSKANCEEKGCSIVTANADGNDFTVTAQVTVPLRLFSMLGLTEHNPVIKRTESAVWEGAFAR